MRKVILTVYTVMFGLSILMLLWIIPAQTPPPIGYGIAPSAMPNFLATVMLLSSGTLLIKTLLNKDAECGPNPLPKATWIHMVKYFSILFLAFPLMTFIGFIPASIILLAALQYLSGQRNMILLVAVAVIVSVGTYYVVSQAMGIDLNFEPLFEF